MTIRNHILHISGIAMLAAIPALSTVSCSHGDKRAAESAAVESIAADSVTPEDAYMAAITSLGIDQVSVGKAIEDLAPSVVNLYDTIVVEDNYENTLYRFMLGGSERFDGYSFGDGTLDVVCAADRSICAVTPAGQLTLGMPFAEVLALDDVEPEFQSLDGTGMWCWIWEGLYFQPSQARLPQQLSARLYNPAVAPGADDFDENVVIEYIGTGMPY